MKMLDRQTSNSRNYGIDALRILSMYMIVVFHVLTHGGIRDAIEADSVNYWTFWFLKIAVFCSVNCYALISGYVGAFTKYKYSNLAILWCRVLFYSILCVVIGKILFPKEIGIKQLLSAFFPVVSNQYWYFTAYFILFLFIPILNVAISTFSKMKMSMILFFIIFVTSVAYPITSLLTDDTFGLNEGYSAWWLMILYLVGGYIRKYGLLNRLKHTLLPLLFVLSVFVTWLSKYVIYNATELLFGGAKASDVLISYLSITILASAVFLFLFFERITISKVWIRIVKSLSPLVFGVYLIHDNNLVRKYFMTNRFAWLASLPWYQMILLVISFSVVIFVMCLGIDLLRYYIFKWIHLKETLEKIEIHLKCSFKERWKEKHE